MVCDLEVPPIVPSSKTLCPASPSLQWVPWAPVPHLPGQALAYPPDHRYYNQLRLPTARLEVLRSRYRPPDTLYMKGDSRLSRVPELPL